MAWFLQSPVDGSEVSRHDEIVKTAAVPVDGSEVLCHDETVEMTSKKCGARAVAVSPRRLCPGR